jgi:hypothetical protein
VEENVPRIYEALCLISTTAKKKKKRRRIKNMCWKGLVEPVIQVIRDTKLLVRGTNFLCFHSPVTLYRIQISLIYKEFLQVNKTDKMSKEKWEEYETEFQNRK